jgi:hypothetical protein
MIITNCKINNGQIVKIHVNTFYGKIKWIIDDVEVAAAELGDLMNENLVPLIGLGYFGD